MAREFPQSVVLLGVRRGAIEPTGAYFATNGSSTFFDPAVPGVGLYDLGQVRIADTRLPEVTVSILARALGYEGLDETARQRLQDALDAAQAGDPLVDYILADELPLPRAARDLGFGGLRIWENDDWADPSSVFIWDIAAVRRLSDIESAQVRAHFANDDEEDVSLQEHQMSSIKATREAIKAIPNMTASCKDGEWRVTIDGYRLSERHPGKPREWCEEKQEAIAYYTDDAEDALGTARQMSEQWGKQDFKWPKDAPLTDAQESFIGVLRSEIGLPRQEALWLQGRLHELSAQHAVLVNMGAGCHGTLSSEQVHAFAEIETRIRELLSDVPGVKAVSLAQDPMANRLTPPVRVPSTVEVQFEGGARLVPLNPQRVDELFYESFWKNYSMNTLYVTLSIEDTGNAAFVDLGRAQEVARIVEKAADQLQECPALLGTAFRLYDINGNSVGELSVAQARPTADLEPGAVRLVIETGNAAFEDDEAGEAARILRDAAATIRNGKESFPLLDINDNTVGEYAYKALPSLERDGVIDMKKALADGRVYLAESGFSGLAEDDYRFIVTADPDFEPGYGQGEGDVWLVNAKGEIASGYEHQETVREDLFDKLPKDMAKKLEHVSLGWLSFEDFEREFGDGTELDPD